jgi:hypothetical protein
LAFIRALDDPAPTRFAVWAVSASAAILCHYFAGFLVTAEALWLVIATRQRSAILASAGVAAVGAALIPLVISQSDNRTQWIEALSLGSRIKEVAKKWVTGEIDPTHGWQLALVAVTVGGALIYGASRLTLRERRGVALCLGAGTGALLIPLVLDVAGLHYLISKNVLPAMAVLLLGAALILAAERAGLAGTFGAAIACLFFLVITIDGVVDPAVQRPDYRGAAKALGPPTRQQAVVTPTLGNAPLAHYRSGAILIPPYGWITNEVIVVDPLPRADVSHKRFTTPSPPPGFTFARRTDARTYTLICYASPVPRLTTLGSLLSLGAANVQVWPTAPNVPRGTESLCSP